MADDNDGTTRSASWRASDSRVGDLSASELHALVRDAVGSVLHREREFDEYYRSQEREAEATVGHVAVALMPMCPREMGDAWDPFCFRMAERLMKMFDIRRREQVN